MKIEEDERDCLVWDLSGMTFDAANNSDPAVVVLSRLMELLVKGEREEPPTSTTDALANIDTLYRNVFPNKAE